MVYRTCLFFKYCPARRAKRLAISDIRSVQLTFAYFRKIEYSPISESKKFEVLDEIREWLPYLYYFNLPFLG